MFNIYLFRVKCYYLKAILNNKCDVILKYSTKLTLQ